MDSNSANRRRRNDGSGLANGHQLSGVMVPPYLCSAPHNDPAIHPLAIRDDCAQVPFAETEETNVDEIQRQLEAAEAQVSDLRRRLRAAREVPLQVRSLERNHQPSPYDHGERSIAAIPGFNHDDLGFLNPVDYGSNLVLNPNSSALAGHVSDSISHWPEPTMADTIASPSINDSRAVTGLEPSTVSTACWTNFAPLMTGSLQQTYNSAVTGGFPTEPNNYSYSFPSDDIYNQISGELTYPEPPATVLPDGQFATAESPSKRKRAESDEVEPAKQMRRHRACLRCRIYRMKCDMGTPCKNCLTVQNTAKIFKQPCFRVSLKDVYPFRGGNSRTGCTRSTLPNFSWEFYSPEILNISVTPLLPYCSTDETPRLSLNCRKFVPVMSDVLMEAFEAADGETMLLKLPPYACFDAESTATQRALAYYLDVCQPFAERAIDNDTDDEVIRLSLKEARRYARSHDTILSKALKIQSTVHITEFVPIIVSNETLGIPAVDNAKFPQHGTVPIPIPLDYQLDTLCKYNMERNLKVVLDGLKTLCFSRKDKRQTWYETFLTILVLLITLEGVYKMQIQYVRKYSGVDDNMFASACRVMRYMIDEWQASAKNLIYHFRCVLKGMIPFSSQWHLDEQKKANLDDGAIRYLQDMSELLARRREELLSLCAGDINNLDAKPLAWVAQLFFDD